jgi:uncharacterized protein
MNLSGETVLVTGANRGIGRALVEELATRDVRVLAGVREVARFTPLSAGQALEVKPVRMDLSSRESIDECVAELGPELERVSVLINNAGVFEGGRFEEQPLDRIYELVQVNLIATMHLTQLVLPQLLRDGRGRIVNNASIAGYVHFPGSAPYAASKAGVVGFSESLRRELKGTGVGVTHLVTPGVDTDMMDATESAYEPYVKHSSGWGHVEPAEGARKVVGAIESDDDVVGPGGPEALAKLASRGPAALVDAIAGRAFDREGK